MNIRRRVNERDVRAAVQEFLSRHKRAATARQSGNLDFSSSFPDAGEGSANDAIRALLDEGRRAMDDRRHTELEECLCSIQHLVEYAMDEIERRGLMWGPPGSQPQWPPLRELGGNLYSFREDVIRRRDRDLLFALLKFDYWIVSEGIRRDCGDMFTEGLVGYRWNYRIATSLGDTEFQEICRDRLLGNAFGIMAGKNPREAFPYIRQMIKHQEQMMSDALNGDQVADFRQLHNRFKNFFRRVARNWRCDNLIEQEMLKMVERLEQDYRVALMGLGDRAVLLANGGTITEIKEYLEVVRTSHGRPEQLAYDMTGAFARPDEAGFGLWEEWEMEGAREDEVRRVLSERFPLIFFGLRLMELATKPIQNLDLHGNAQRVLSWFKENTRQFESHLQSSLNLTVEDRRKFAIDALKAAVRKDDVEEDYRLIRRDLSVDRLSAFVADVYATAFATNVIERVFEEKGVYMYLPPHAREGPSPRYIRELEPKGFLADALEDAPIYYLPLEGHQYGQRHSDDIVQLLCEAMAEAPKLTGRLNTTSDFLRAIDSAADELRPTDQLVVVLVGDWAKILIELATEQPDGYEPGWKAHGLDPLGEVDRYHGHPIVTLFNKESRRIYIVDPPSWGCFVRAQMEGAQDLLVEVSPVSSSRARELLDGNPRHFSGEPDEVSKLRKLQTCVEIVVGSRVSFRVTDPTRARRFVECLTDNTQL